MQRIITSVTGYPRIGPMRELKFWIEKYWKDGLQQRELQASAKELRIRQWKLQRDTGVDLIPSNDFSFYDGMLDAAMLLGVIPERYRALKLTPLDTCFAMARGYQGGNGDVKALPMRKWFNTNYHYIVPEIGDDTRIGLNDAKPTAEFLEAEKAGIHTKPVLIGGFTFLRLAKYFGRKTAEHFAEDVTTAYSDLLREMDELGVQWVQFDEPMLCTDVSSEDIALFHGIYSRLLSRKGRVKVLLQTYFGDVRDVYSELISLDFDGIVLDFVEGNENIRLIEEYGFPDDKMLFAGVVNGKNVWAVDYPKTLQKLDRLQGQVRQLAISTSCSLLHVPYTVKAETELNREDAPPLAFAQEKLAELATLRGLMTGNDSLSPEILWRNNEDLEKNPKLRQQTNGLPNFDCVRLPDRGTRARLQAALLKLPQLPTTTIGSFPQTRDVKSNRARYRKGSISREAYQDYIKRKIADCITLQEEIGLDVLVHGEFERNDMVEYFAEHLNGFLFTENGWVQSYGTRCVKPPVIHGEISRKGPISVEFITYAQSLTAKPVKGMLTGPVTILNWSFAREDISPGEAAFQIALAIREEVMDLEAHGIRIIQIDEAALKEKLPLRRSQWHTGYLDWAIPAFRLVHCGVQPETQIHTHMCYSEFEDIIPDIDAMDADVITFEAARSNLSILEALKGAGFNTAVGPGVYDIHSPRIPAVDEMKQIIREMLKMIPGERLWVNPDCGLKTRGEEETLTSLRNLVSAARKIRREMDCQAGQ